MEQKKFFGLVLDNIESVLHRNNTLGQELWEELNTFHGADIAQFLEDINKDTAHKLFESFTKQIKIDVFYYLTNSSKAYLLQFLTDHEISSLLNSLPTDELTDLFDEFSNEELDKYLRLLHKEDRDEVISLMQFDSDSAGGLMQTNILTFMADFTIEKSIQILQRLQPNQELYQTIYVTSYDNELLGCIRLQDLVLKNPKTRLSTILLEPELIINVTADKKEIARKMMHYKVMVVPVTENNKLLGVISSDTLVDIIEEVGAEDVYKISALPLIKDTYFETPFWNLFYQRSSILIVLLLVQTISQLIINKYEAIIAGFLGTFLTMIASTGGNSSSQTAALAIQGMASGEISSGNMNRFLKREMLMAAILGLALGCVSFFRIFITYPQAIWANIAVSCSLCIIVIFSVMLGSFLPVFLKKLNLDPAFSAGPFLATIMDIVGLLIYCFICQLIF